MKEPPEPCATCGAKPALRSTCKVCGERVWVVEHSGHYKWGREVVQCRCCDPKSREIAKRRYEKKMKRRERDTGKPRSDMRKPVTTPEMAKKTAEGLARGLSVRRAMLEAGFPERTSNQGRKGINRMVRAELKTLGRKYVELGRDLSPEDQEAMVRGRLVESTIIGTDKGVMAAKQLGADKRVAMWQPDSQVGLVVLQAPQVRKIMHEVPILPPVEDTEEDEPGNAAV